MKSDWSRIEIDNGIPRLRANGVALDLIVEALAAGQDLVAVTTAFAVTPADLIATLGYHALGPEGSEGLSLVTEGPKDARLRQALTEPAWAQILPGVPRPKRLALASGLLQVFDEWNSSHEAAQEADDLGERSYSAYWHAIAHRREPDAGNASYWFRRVGRHPVQGLLARASVPLLERHGDSTVSGKMPKGEWNPFAMIELCGDGRPPANVVALARTLQRLEMKLLLEATAEACTS